MGPPSFFVSAGHGGTPSDRSGSFQVASHLRTIAWLPAAERWPPASFRLPCCGRELPRRVVSQTRSPSTTRDETTTPSVNPKGRTMTPPFSFPGTRASTIRGCRDKADVEVRFEDDHDLLQPAVAARLIGRRPSRWCDNAGTSRRNAGEITSADCRLSLRESCVLSRSERRLCFSRVPMKASHRDMGSSTFIRRTRTCLPMPTARRSFRWATRATMDTRSSELPNWTPWPMM